MDLQEDLEKKHIMRGVILVGHKPIAGAVLEAAGNILGKIEKCAAADIDSDETEKERLEVLEQAWKESDPEDLSSEKVVLIDLPGATPANTAELFCSGRRVISVHPLSLSLLLKVLSYRSLPSEELTRKMQEISVCAVSRN